MPWTAFFIVNFNIAMMIPLLPFIQQDIGLTPVQAGLVLAAFPVSALVANLAIGPFNVAPSLQIVRSIVIRTGPGQRIVPATGACQHFDVIDLYFSYTQWVSCAGARPALTLRRQASPQGKEGTMLSRKDYMEWTLKDHKDKDYKSDAAKRFFDKVENPPKPNEKLKEIVREYGKFAKQDRS